MGENRIIGNRLYYLTGKLIRTDREGNWENTRGGFYAPVLFRPHKSRQSDIYFCMKKAVKRIAIALASVLFLCIVFTVDFFGETESVYGKITVVLDAGHGGIDGGVIGVSTKVKESTINLAIVQYLRKYLQAAQINVVLTRKDSGGLYGLPIPGFKKRDMQKRRDIIQAAHPNAVVSVHQNSYPLSTHRGSQVFYRGDSEIGLALAEKMQAELNELRKEEKPRSVLSGDYYILNCTEYPSVIAECGFLSNPQDEALLITEEYRQKVAYALFRGVIAFLATSASSE